jgi:hypothetical protein
VALSTTRAVRAPARSRRVHWQALLEECRRSGLSQAEFCRQRGVVPGTLAFWKHTLARATPAARSGSRRARPAAPTFVPLRVIERSPAPHTAIAADSVPAARSEIEIVLPRHRRVRVRGRVDAHWLGEIVRMLEGLGC